MDPNILLAIGAGLLLTLLLLWLLKLLKDLSEESGGGSGDSGDEDRGMSEADMQRARERMARQRAREAAQKTAYLAEILGSSDEAVKAELMRQSGLKHKDLVDVSSSAALVEKVAAKMNLPEVKALHVALTTKDIKTTSTSSEKTEIVQYPTNQMEPGRLQDLNNFDQVTPEALGQDPTLLAYQMATGTLPVMDSYESENQIALHYLLGDISGSMAESLNGEYTKSVYARGAIYRFLIQAQEGKAKCFLRFFDGETHRLLEATTPEQAERVMEVVKNEAFSGGGTNIKGGLEKAADDIKSREGQITSAEIVLISDGQDDRLPDADGLRKILGNIKLHVIAIGSNNPSLREVATTYTEVK